MLILDLLLVAVLESTQLPFQVKGCPQGGGVCILAGFPLPKPEYLFFIYY